MTRDALTEANKIVDKIKEIERVIYDIKPYFRNDIEITVQKTCNGYNGQQLFYRLSSDSPLWLAIGSALEDMKAELEKQLDELNTGKISGEKDEPEPIQKTSFWKKVWVKGGKCKFI